VRKRNWNRVKGEKGKRQSRPNLSAPLATSEFNEKWENWVVNYEEFLRGAFGRSRGDDVLSVVFPWGGGSTTSRPEEWRRTASVTTLLLDELAQNSAERACHFLPGKVSPITKRERDTGRTWATPDRREVGQARGTSHANASDQSDAKKSLLITTDGRSKATGRKMLRGTDVSKKRRSERGGKKGGHGRNGQFLNVGMLATEKRKLILRLRRQEAKAGRGRACLAVGWLQ